MEGGAQVVVISYHQKSEAAQGQVQDYHLFLHLLLRLSIQIISLDQSRSTSTSRSIVVHILNQRERNTLETNVCFIYIHEISEEADFFTMIFFEKMNRRFSLSLKMLNESETEMERAYKSTDKIFDQRTYIVHTMNLRG